MSLYNRYRPQSFNDMVGNKEELKSLEDQLKNENRSHVYLFTGPSGCGKTTAARITANMIDAEIQEYNSANNRGIDTAREIIERNKYSPLLKNKLVYIIDEAHKCTSDFWNALLKPLEDHPDFVFYIICTTEDTKIPKAVHTRSKKYKFNYLKSVQIFKIISRIVEEEQIEIDEEVLEEISENCDGSPRQAIVLLEKVMNIEKQKALKIIGNIEEDSEIIDLCRGLLKGMDWTECAKILKSIKDKDTESVRYAILGYMNSVLLSGKQNDRAAQIMYEFKNPFYNSGKAGLTLACFMSLFQE